MKTVVICAGGPSSEIPDLTEFVQEDTIFIGADRGTLHLLGRNIIPVEAVGDFDSVSQEEYDLIVANVENVGRFQSEKDETDTELAVTHALTYNPDHIVLTGVTGGRLDHMQSALHLLYRIQRSNGGICFSIRNKLNELVILPAGVHKIKTDTRFTYCSFFPFGGTVTGLTLTGFKYETVDELLETGMTKFTSNEPVEDVCTISFLKGICLMVRSSDS